MSWIRSALHKAADVPKNIGPNLTRTVRNYAGTVYQHAEQAVSGGAKVMQERLSGRNLNNFKNAVKRLNEVSLHIRGVERTQALSRWLSALKSIELDRRKPSQKEDNADPDPASPSHLDNDGSLISPRSALALFYDFDNGGQPMTFRDVFLSSHALENIVASMILEAPTDEELAMLLDIFRLCLKGGQELHNAIASGIQDLAKALSSHKEEVEITNATLLQMAQDALCGLKISAEEERLSMELSYLEGHGLFQLKDNSKIPASENEKSGEFQNTVEETGAILDFGERLRDCLQRHEIVQKACDIQEHRQQKVITLKELKEGLIKSTGDLEKQMLENRQEKEKALKYRLVKTNEVAEAEKALSTEVQELEKRRQKLESELKEVNAALAVATARHVNIQEEKEQFDDANSSIITHLSIQEEQLSLSKTARATETGVLSTWMDFLEDMLRLQSNVNEEMNNEVVHVIDDARTRFLFIGSTNLAYHLEELKLLLDQLKSLQEKVRTFPKSDITVENAAPEQLTASEGDIEQKMYEDKYIHAKNQALRGLDIMEKLARELQPLLGKDRSLVDVEQKIMSYISALDQLRKAVSAINSKTDEPVELETSNSRVEASKEHTLQESQESQVVPTDEHTL